MKRKLFYLFLVASGCGLLLTLGARFIMPRELQHGAQASWLSHYEDYPTLVRESEVIVVGQVITSRPFLGDQLVYTSQQVEVQEVLTGKVAVGDILPIIQTGGMLEKENQETAPFLDSPLMEEGKTYLLFLERSRYEPDSWWWLMGGYQGRADIRNNGTLGFTSRRLDRDQGEPVARNLHGRNLKDVRIEIQKILTDVTTP